MKKIKKFKKKFFEDFNSEQPKKTGRSKRKNLKFEAPKAKKHMFQYLEEIE